MGRIKNGMLKNFKSCALAASLVAMT